MKRERCFLFGVGLDPVDMSGMVRAADDTIRAGQQCAIFAVNPEKIMAAQRSPALRAQLNAAEWLIPDGIGAVWAARRRGCRVPGRVTGADLMPALCALAAQRGYRVFLFGAREENNAAAAARLVETHPGLVVAGRRHGYIGVDDEAALVDEINASGADILFVALGSPRQEDWISRHRSKLRVNVLQGVGGTFDVLSGAVDRAPRIWIRLHLEWLYRLVREPSRLRRQSPRFYFAFLVLSGRLTDRPLPLREPG
jgi:N-acetylglucosaminyldiphosphoundecaprenol N-acetyl-beta-D-mannosaminyltransferase